jgi:ribosomal protein L32
MAVPKKKISYSRTKKKFLVKKSLFNLYNKCDLCLNFSKLHCICSSCFKKGVSLQLIKGKIKNNSTNINHRRVL